MSLKETIRRPHLLEIEDQSWLPQVIRDAMTDYLRFAIRVGNHYGPIVERLKQALLRTGSSRIVDLCSGGGGPWPELHEALTREQLLVELCLTDKFPNVPAWRRVQESNSSRIGFYSQPVDATDVPAELQGFRTLFTSFHHFRPHEAQAILADAARKRQGIGVFEATQRHPAAVLGMLLAPFLVLLFTPFIRPFQWPRFFWTYLVPVVPGVVLFDGVVSCLRTYTLAELHTLIEGLREDGYCWEVGEERGARSVIPVTYLIGYPSETMPAK